MCIRDSGIHEGERIFYYDGTKNWWSRNGNEAKTPVGDPCGCLLYTSDAADERSSVDLGGRRIIKKKKKKHRGDGRAR